MIFCFVVCSLPTDWCFCFTNLPTDFLEESAPSSPPLRRFFRFAVVSSAIHRLLCSPLSTSVRRLGSAPPLLCILLLRLLLLRLLLLRLSAASLVAAPFAAAPPLAAAPLAAAPLANAPLLLLHLSCC